MRVTLPTETGNAALKDGTLQAVIKSQIEKLRPEASYFYAEGGQRSCLMVIDLKDSSDIPSIAEPFFAGLNAKVELLPVMNAAELDAGLRKVVK